MIKKKHAWIAIHPIFDETVKLSRDTPVSLSWVVGVALGMGVPITIGVEIGQIDLGILASIGGFALSSATSHGTLRQQSIQLSYALAASTVAIFVGSAIGGHGWITGVAIVIITVLSALLGSLGRTIARYCSSFIVIVIIGTSFGEAAVCNPILMTLIFTIGAIWTVVIYLIISYLFQSASKEINPILITSADQQCIYFLLKCRLRHWLASLYYRIGWQYALRIGLCMIAAETIAVLWNQPRSYWIALVVAIVVQRSFRTTISRIFQRGIGTFAGVLAGSIFIMWHPTIWILVLVIYVLAALRPLLKVRNYALYSTVMTPLVLILLEFGKPISSALMVYRFIDTVIGLSIAIVLGYLIWPPQHSKNIRYGG